MDPKTRLLTTSTIVIVSLPCLIGAVIFTLIVQPDHFERRIWPSIAILYVMATVLKRERLCQGFKVKDEKLQERLKLARMITYAAGALILAQLLLSFTPNAPAS